MKLHLLAGWAMLFLAGCASIPAPSVNLVNVRFTEATVLETTAQFTLRLSNPNPEPVRVTGSAHRIYLNGLYIGEALSNETMEVPGLATATQAVTVHLNNLAMATRIKAIIEARVFDYKIDSVFYTDSRRTRSTSNGRLDLKDFTPATPGNSP